MVHRCFPNNTIPGMVFQICIGSNGSQRVGMSFSPPVETRSKPSAPVRRSTLQSALAVSERHFERHLSEAWRRGFQHVSERRTANVSVHRAVRVELCVVERVEGFETELERLGFCKFCDFMESDVEIVNTRPVEEAPLGVPLCPQSIRSEQ